MGKVTFAVKLDENILIKLKKFCAEHGTKYSFFVERAVQEKLIEEEKKEDLLDFKTLHKEEAHAMSFEEYLKERDV